MLLKLCLFNLLINALAMKPAAPVTTIIPFLFVLQIYTLYPHHKLDCIKIEN